MTLRILFSGIALAALLSGFAAAGEMNIIPAPAVDQAAPAASESIVLAGGCFWGVQGVFQHTKGVLGAVSGYAGGSSQTAEYHAVGSGATGHAEAVKVTFDPKQITLGRILQIYFSVAHDPTQLNRQGPDSGTQYRSAIFPDSEEQAAISKAYIAQLDKARVYDAAIATKIEAGKTFYPAEAYHQDYMTLYPEQDYIVSHDLPKVAALKKVYPAAYRTEPVLVNAKAAKEN